MKYIWHFFVAENKFWDGLEGGDCNNMKVGEETEIKMNINQSKYGYMLESSKNHMDNTALTFKNKKITYEELVESIDKYAKVLYSKGIRKA